MSKIKNKGLSYVELMVSIAIMAIAVGLVTITVSAVNRNDIGRACEKIASSLNEGRNAALTGGTNKGWVTFAYHNGSIMCNVGEEFNSSHGVNFSTQSWKKVCSGKQITVIGNTKNLNSEGDYITINFKQSTGEIYKYRVNDDPDTDNVGAITFTVKNGSKTNTVLLNSFGKVEKY